LYLKNLLDVIATKSMRSTLCTRAMQSIFLFFVATTTFWTMNVVIFKTKMNQTTTFLLLK